MVINFVKRPVALEKTPEMIKSFSTEEVKNQVGSNLLEIMKRIPAELKTGVLAQENFPQLFSLSGGYKFQTVEELGVASDFFSQTDRTFKKGETYHTHGARYLVALDRSLSVLQKIEILKEDFKGAILAVKNNLNQTQTPYREIAPLMDYAKNAIVTLFNSLVYQERVGDRQYDDDYLALRARVAKLMEETVSCFYLALLNKVSSDHIDIIITGFDLVEELAKKMQNSFSDRELSSRSFVRPEASHPLVILGFLFGLVEKLEAPDMILTMPAGATELGCAVARGYKVLRGIEPSLYLLPVSLHAEKERQLDSNYLDQFFASPGQSNRVLIVDDNSSTGQTIQLVRDYIKSKFSSEKIFCAVAEADIVRTWLDLDNLERTHIADPALYDFSVSILPVSKSLMPKYDLREISENNQLAHYYQEQSENATTALGKIKFSVFAEEIARPMETILQNTDPEKIIPNFQKTFLSNFYAVELDFAGTSYPSVEHAYQAQKFKLKNLAVLADNQIDHLNELLKSRGYLQRIEDFAVIFTDPTFTAGNVKLVAEVLRDFNLQRLDWDEVRVDIMIELLLQKFRQTDLKARLLETGDKILVEGNDWQDTYWGICQNRGKNFLGRSLMKIREGNYV